MRIKRDHALNNCYGYGHLHAYIRAGFQGRGEMTEKTGVVWQVDDFSERRDWALPIPRRMLAMLIPERRTTPRTCAGLGLDLWKHDVEAEACLSRGSSREEIGRRVNLIFATPVASTTHMNSRLVTDYCASLKVYGSIATNEFCG